MLNAKARKMAENGAFSNRLRLAMYRKMVPRRGLEPPRRYQRQHLKLVRLPIPPSGHGVGGALSGRVFGLSMRCAAMRTIFMAMA
jgi:hypothetical protein